MSDTQKKVALGLVIVVALGLAVWQGFNLIAGPRPVVTKQIDAGFSASHTGKGAMMAHEGGAKGGGNLAGPPRAGQ